MVISAEENKNIRMVNFFANYEKNVLPILEKYERNRIQEIRNTFIYCLIILPLIILVMWWLNYRQGTNIFESLEFFVHCIPYLLIILFFFGFAILVIQNNFYKKGIKTQLMLTVMSSFEDLFWSRRTSWLNYEQIVNSGLFGYFSVAMVDDAFQGTYKDVPFIMQETILADDIQYDNTFAFGQAFKGVIIAIKSNKPIKAKTVIATKGDKNILNSRFLYFEMAMVIICLILILGGWDNIMVSSIISGVILVIFTMLGFLATFSGKRKVNKKLKPVYLEDPVFNKKYKTYSEDQIEGRYLVTTAFMHRFKNLHTVFGTRSAKCAFFDNMIMFALPVRNNLFEFSGGLFCSLKNPKYIRAFYEEISAVYDIIDYFKLAEKNGL